MNVGRIFAALWIAAWLWLPAAWAASLGQADLERGTELYEAGQFEAAVEAFQAASEKDPGLMLAWENLGWAHRRLGQNDSAVEVWETLLLIEPERQGLWEELAVIATEAGRSADAVRYYEESLDAGEDRPKTRLRLAQALEHADRPEDAIRQYLRVAADPEWGHDADLRMAELHERSGDLGAALELLEGRLGRESGLKQLEVRGRLARLHAKQGDEAYRAKAYAQASDRYRKALELEPAVAQYWLNLGWASQRQGAQEEALTAWRRASELDPKHWDAPQALALALLNKGDDEEADRWLREAWRRGAAREPGTLYLQAKIALERGEVQTALPHIRDLLATAPADGGWHERIARLMARHDQAQWMLEWFASLPTTPAVVAGRVALNHELAGRALAADDLATAAARLADALAEVPNHRESLRDLGWVLWRQKEWRACETTWRRYAAAYPKEPQPWSLLAGLYLQNDAADLAIPVARHSLALQPDQPDTQLKLANALLRTASYGEGIGLAENLAQRYPEHLGIQTLRGDLLMQRQAFAEGVAQWRRVLDLGSENPRARYYWVRSLYESGQYDTALAEAERLQQQYGPNERLLQLLAEDAMVTSDREAALRQYRELTANFPTQPKYWLELARLHHEQGDDEQSLSILEQAVAAHPDNADLMLARADAQRSLGQHDVASQEYAALLDRFPDNRHAHMGAYYSARATGDHATALGLLEGNRPIFFAPYEVLLERGELQAEQGQIDAAESDLDRVSHPAGAALNLPILLYHGLSTNDRSVNLHAARFEDQMAALDRAGYTPLTFGDLADILDGRRSAPGRPVLITFDDARRDALELADPSLARHSMKATMFVPTGRIQPDHPFFADWDRLRQYHATGRWDLQNHGHHAHDLISVDAQGTTGAFLANRLWLAREGRIETATEYLVRLEEDYNLSSRLLDAAAPDSKVLAYSFPFSEMGQEGQGNEPAAFDQNRKIVETRFRFAVTQDQSGFNVIEPPAGNGLLLRRYSVPRDWSGEELLAHLTSKDPRHRALLSLARQRLWSGRLDAAEETLLELRGRAPRMRRVVSFHLASVAYQKGHYRAAQRLLEESGETAAIQQTLERPLDRQAAARAIDEMAVFRQAPKRPLADRQAAVRGDALGFASRDPW